MASWDVDRTWLHVHQLEEEIGLGARDQLLLNYTIRAVAHSQDPALKEDRNFDAVADALAVDSGALLAWWWLDP